jgi:hypothetical protein
MIPPAIGVGALVIEIDIGTVADIVPPPFPFSGPYRIQRPQRRSGNDDYRPERAPQQEEDYRPQKTDESTS